MVFVFQLYQGAAELGHVVIHHILQRFAAELGAVLDDAHVADGVNYIGVDIPEGRVAEQVRVVVKETGRADDLAEILPVLLDELGAFGMDEDHFVILLLLLGADRQNGCREKRQPGQEDMTALPMHYFREFQISRENSHSLKMGSMTMYVSLTFSLRKASMASICLAPCTRSSSSL